MWQSKILLDIVQVSSGGVPTLTPFALPGTASPLEPAWLLLSLLKCPIPIEDFPLPAPIILYFSSLHPSLPNTCMCYFFLSVPFREAQLDEDRVFVLRSADLSVPGTEQTIPRHVFVEKRKASSCYPPHKSTKPGQEQHDDYMAESRTS